MLASKPPIIPAAFCPKVVSVSKDMTMQFDCDNLAAEWDSNGDTRARLRDGRHLVGNKDTTKDATIFQCVSNNDVLPPMLHRLYGCGLKMPQIDALQDQCLEVYRKASRDPCEKVVEDDAWELRKMCRFIKRKARRGEVSLEFGL